MKVCMFHLMPYRDLPKDYAQRYQSAHIDPLWFDVADAEKVGQYFNWTLDELLYAAESGFHGLCTNQHHQNVYGFMANPSLMGSVLARQTNGTDVAIIQIGSTLPSTSPIRIAEEYAIIDLISGGRLVAGFPTGLPSDATISNGVVPLEQRERYREAMELVLKAWSAKELFAWNGKHYQYPAVNLWPRPLQQNPHPPIWIPGSGITKTAEYVVDRDDCFCHLSYHGAANAEKTVDRYWELCEQKGRDINPHRFSFLQIIGVSETDEQSKEYAEHAEYFFHNLLATPRHYQAIPGCLDYESLQAAVATPQRAYNLREMKFKDFVERGFLITGSPKTVRDQLLHWGKRLRIGHLLTLLHFGSMPTELCRQNIELFGSEVLPHLAPMWNDEWEDHWWPERLRQSGRATALASAAQ